MPATRHRKPVAPDAVSTPPTGYYGDFQSDGSTATLSPGSPTTIANTWYLIGPGPTRALAVLGQAIRFQKDHFASAAGPFTLSQTYSGAVNNVYFDGRWQRQTTFYTISGTTLTLAGGVDPTLFSDIDVVYTY